MKIGIVSAQKHCKTHLQALSGDGWDVTCLGDKPRSIPSSYDALVVRVASVAHSAVDVARKWAVTTERPVIYENGLTGIRRSLEDLTSNNEGQNMPQMDIPQYLGDTRRLPTDEKWSQVYDKDKIFRSYKRAAEILVSSNHMTLTGLTDAIKTGRFSRTVKGRWVSLIAGDPLTFAFVVVVLNPNVSKKTITETYKSITNKGTDTRLKTVVEWAFGWGAYTETVVEEAVEDTPEEKKAVTPVSPDAVESNTEAILTLMDDLSTFKNEIRADVAKVSAGLESRIKSLELGASETLRQAQTGARMAVEAMSEELRADISNAFDSLAAEAQAASNPASNPLAALEQVKAALKAAGFTGTLTLTIE